MISIIVFFHRQVLRAALGINEAHRRQRETLENIIDVASNIAFDATPTSRLSSTALSRRTSHPTVHLVIFL